MTLGRLNVKSRSHHDIANLLPHLISLPSINFPHLTVAETYPGQEVTGQGNYGKVKGQFKVTMFAHLQHLSNIPS